MEFSFRQKAQGRVTILIQAAQLSQDRNMLSVEALGDL